MTATINTAGVAVYETNPYAYVSNDRDGIVWHCGHHHRTDEGATRCLPRAKREASLMNAEESS